MEGMVTDYVEHLRQSLLRAEAALKAADLAAENHKLAGRPLELVRIDARNIRDNIRDTLLKEMDRRDA